jgi:hypothetical protein
MKRKYKKELQSIYEMSLSNDLESKDLAINLFWTSEYVKANKIKPELSLYVTENGRKGLRGTIDYYTGEINTSRYDNFSCILYDLIRDKVHFVKKELK